MVNLENKLTVDDMIVEYLMYKCKNGYEPSFLASEFIDFIKYFESKKEVYDVIYDKKELFDRFFERKQIHDWYEKYDIDLLRGLGENPHMNMEKIDGTDDYIIKANYKFSYFDRSVINTYFMSTGYGNQDNPKGEVGEIRTIIGEYLKDKPKRELDENVELTEQEINMGKIIGMLLLKNVWESHIEEYIKYGRWPIQCTDINKYLFETDLAQTIVLQSIKGDLIKFYKEISKRIAIMYHHDKKLQIRSYENVYLARSNYELLIKGYENIISIAFGEYKKSLDINIPEYRFRETHELNIPVDWYDDPPTKTTEDRILLDETKLKRIKDFENSLKSA